MDARQKLFLEALTGVDGALALSKATELSVEVARAVVPRVIMAWLDIVGRGDFDGTVPGLTNTLSFKKSESGYSGSIECEKDLSAAPYAFKDASIYHLAGSVALAMGVEDGPSTDIQQDVLAKLGRSVDLLVKSRIVLDAVERSKKAKKAEKPANEKISLPGAPAAPIQVGVPTPPTAVQPEVGADTPLAAGSSERPPKAKAIKKTIRISKSQLQSSCPICKQGHFEKYRFVGCPCLSDLAKSVKTIHSKAGLVLEVAASVDEDALATLIESLHEKAV